MAVYFCLFICALLLTDLTWQKRHVGVIVQTLGSLCPPSVYMKQTWRGASRVASGPPSACTSRLFEALRRGRLGMINGAGGWGWMTRSAAQLQTPGQLPYCAATRHSQLSDNAAYMPMHTHKHTQICVTHLPGLPLKSLRAVQWRTFMSFYD